MMILVFILAIICVLLCTIVAIIDIIVGNSIILFIAHVILAISWAIIAKNYLDMI